MDDHRTGEVVLRHRQSETDWARASGMARLKGAPLDTGFLLERKSGVVILLAANAEEAAAAAVDEENAQLKQQLADKDAEIAALKARSSEDHAHS